MDDKEKNTCGDPEKNQGNNKDNNKKWSAKKKNARLRSEALKKIINFYKDKKQND
jgi:hypothetical protein